VLVDIVRAPSGFLLLGADEHDDRCRVFGAVLRDDYMTVNLAKGAAFLLPYSAINSIDRTQLGTVTVPVIHMVGNPHVKFCAD
jgi:hypothetical protein